MASLTDIRAAIAAKLVAAVDDAQCSGYVLASPTPPFFDVDLADPALDYSLAANSGAHEWHFVVRGVAQESIDVAAQQSLDAWVDSDLIKNALEADQTLNGTVSAVFVEQLSGYRQIAISNTLYLAVAWAVRVLTE